MPVDSYIEKGLLADLSQVTQSIGEQEGMYENIADTYRTQEGLFAVPSRFSIPVIQAGQKALEGIDSLKTLADTAQKLREENQEAPAVLESGDMEELDEYPLLPVLPPGRQRMEPLTMKKSLSFIPPSNRSMTWMSTERRRERLAISPSPLRAAQGNTAPCGIWKWEPYSISTALS